MHRRLLLCPPDFYSVQYIINPWMRPDMWAAEKPRLSARAKDQWLRLTERLAGAGAVLDFIAPHAELPDMVFAANFAFILNQTALMSRFAVPQRMAESALAAAWLNAQNFNVQTVDCDFEGGGDALFDKTHQMIWLGHGFRSQPQAATTLHQHFQLPVETLELVDARFYHLDTCFCPLPLGHALVYRPAFTAEAFAKIKWIYAGRLLEVEGQDAEHFACNAVPVGNKIVLPEISENLKDSLRQHGYEARPTPLDSFILAGGAARCLTLPLDDKTVHLPLDDVTA